MNWYLGLFSEVKLELNHITLILFNYKRGCQLITTSNQSKILKILLVGGGDKWVKSKMVRWTVDTPWVV